MLWLKRWQDKEGAATQLVPAVQSCQHQQWQGVRKPHSMYVPGQTTALSPLLAAQTCQPCRCTSRKRLFSFQTWWHLKWVFCWSPCPPFSQTLGAAPSALSPGTQITLTGTFPNAWPHIWRSSCCSDKIDASQKHCVCHNAETQREEFSQVQLPPRCRTDGFNYSCVSFLYT